jgi:hypothetical protein
MSDVFISYARADVAFARAIAECLEREGFSVWWDRKLSVGDAFDDEIGEQLDMARGVVVLWSSHSIKSKWVKDEAAEGLGRKALFPVMLEAVRLPFGYRRVQTADFTGWKPPENHAAFERLTAALKEALGGAGSGARSGGPAAAPARPGWFLNRWRRSIVFRIAALALPVVVIAASARTMTQVRVPTLVQVQLLAEMVQFTVGGSGLTSVFEPLPFASLRIERFHSVSFSPKTLRVAPETRPGAWRELNPVPEIALTAPKDEALQPWVEIEPISTRDGPLGMLDSFSLQPGNAVTLERKKARLPYVKIRISKLNDPLSLAANAGKPFRLQTSDVDSGALGFPGATGSWVLEAQNKDSRPAFGIRSAPSQLDLKVGVAGASALPLLSKAVPIAGVTLAQPDAQGEWVSTLIADGQLQYPDHPDVAPVKVSKSDLVIFADLSKFSITELDLNPEVEGLRVRLDGTVNKLKVKTGQVERDLRLTVLQTYAAQFKVAFLATVIIGAASAMWSATILLRELRA